MKFSLIPILVFLMPLCAEARVVENAFARDRIPPQANVAQALQGILQGDLGRNSRKQVVLEDVLLVNGERLQLDLTAVSAFDDSAPGANNGIQVLTSALSSDADYLALLQVDTNTGETTGFLQSKIDGKVYDIVQRGQGNAPLMVTEASEFVPPVTSMFQDSLEVPTDRLRHRRMQVDDQVDEMLQDQHKRRELQTSDYSYEVSIFFEMDNQFIIDSPGSANTFAEAAAYLDVIISGLNLVYEKEIDTHISINGVALTTRYDGATGTSDALAILRAAKQGTNWPAGADLTHALIGRNLGGGIAYRGVICNTGYGFGISANLSGTYQQGSTAVVWDIMVTAHEIGHNFDAPHAHDTYFSPPVDSCYDDSTKSSTCPSTNLGTGWSTLMSYCHLCSGGVNNMRLTFGGYQISSGTWVNDEDLMALGFSVDPKRVPQRMYAHVSSRSCTAIQGTLAPTGTPTSQPTRQPSTSAPTSSTKPPTSSPTTSPTKAPTVSPTKAPTVSPTAFACSNFDNNKVVCNSFPTCSYSNKDKKCSAGGDGGGGGGDGGGGSSGGGGDCSSYSGNKSACLSNGCSWSNRNKTCS